MEINSTNNNLSLAEALNEKKSKSEQSPDTTKKRIYKEGIESVVVQNITQTALQVGDQAPNFILKNAQSQDVALYECLEKGPVVLTRYRGGWCPYCNITLHYLQEELPKFKANGANLIALTPEVPDKSLSTSEKNELEFEVLSDVGNVIAKQYGIVYKLTDEVAEIYENNFGLSEYNGNKDNELPLAATYIIDEDGTIQYAFLDADYRNRAEPSVLTAFLKSMQ